MMDASRDTNVGSGRWCGGGVPGARGSSPSLSVLLSKKAVVTQVLLTYTAVSCVTLALSFLAGPIGTRAALALLVFVMPHVFLGAALLCQRAPVLEVDACGGLRVRPPALLGEKFTPFGRTLAVGWDNIHQWEVAPSTLPLGLPCPWRGSVLRVVLRQPEAFVAEQGCLWGRIRFTWKALRYGTPLVVSDAVLQLSVQEIAEFMNSIRARGEERSDGVSGFEVTPLPSIPFVVVVR